MEGRGPERRLHGAAAPAVANGDGGGVSAGLGGRDLAVELQGEEGMPFRGMAWVEEGWRRELGGGAWAAAMAGGCGSRSGEGRERRVVGKLHQAKAMLVEGS